MLNHNLIKDEKESNTLRLVNNLIAILVFRARSLSFANGYDISSPSDDTTHLGNGFFADGIGNFWIVVYATCVERGRSPGTKLARNSRGGHKSAKSNHPLPTILCPQSTLSFIPSQFLSPSLASRFTSRFSLGPLSVSPVPRYVYRYRTSFDTAIL